MRAAEIKHLNWSNDQCAVFCAGHVNASEFLEAAKPVIDRECGKLELDEVPDATAVEHAWFRMMSPSEAKAAGYNFGYRKVNPPAARKRGGPFPVTLLVF